MAGGARQSAIMFVACAAVALVGLGPTGKAAAAPAAAAQPGVVAGSFSTSARQALSHWTAVRRRGAEPLPPRLLDGRSSNGARSGDGEAVGPPSYVPPRSPGASAAELRTGALRRTAADTAAIEGTDTGDSTAFPNNANGIVYGEYRTRLAHESYQCSGSVISSASGSVVLTAGHCVIDPETGTVASYVVFVPGYREGNEPFGEWGAEAYATTPQWAETAGTREPDEAGDLAMLVLEDHEGKSVQSEVGALGIAFNQAREQTYTQSGYPAEEPYDPRRRQRRDLQEDPRRRRLPSDPRGVLRAEGV